MQIENCTYDTLTPLLNEFEDSIGLMNICFLLTHVPNPRMNKRIEVCKKRAKTQVICTRRLSQNVWEPAQDVEHVIYNIDLPSVRHIIKRYFVSMKFQKNALNKLEDLRPNIIYAEGLDTLIIASKYKRKHDVKIIYEVADLRECYITKPKNVIEYVFTSILLWCEKVVFPNVNFLVVTSPKFFDMHYKRLISKERLFFIPNAPDMSCFVDYKKKLDGEFTVGFIGGIRYLRQMKMLVEAAEKVNCKVLFAGAGGTSNDYKEIQTYCKDKHHVKFTGKYDYNTQIANLYSQVDCVYAVYDADNPNVRIAIPNKFYESIICELPLIVSKETYLAELVNELGIGISVSHVDVNELVNALSRLKEDKKYYESFVENCRKQKVGLDKREMA